MIDTLKQQHQELSQLIRQLDVAVERGEQAGMLATLSQLSQTLQIHMELEHRKLYPAVACAAEARGDEKMLETAYLFFNNMHRITDALQDFMFRHEADFHLERFRTCWRTFSSVLTRRIEAEERMLYPLYARRLLVSDPSFISESPSLAS